MFDEVAMLKEEKHQKVGQIQLRWSLATSNTPQGEVKIEESLQSETAIEAPQLRRSQRTRKKPKRFRDEDEDLVAFPLITENDEQSCYQEATLDENQNNWLDAVNSKMNSLRRNQTWDLVKLPEGGRRQLAASGFSGRKSLHKTKKSNSRPDWWLRDLHSGKV